MSRRRIVYTDWRSTLGRDIKRVAGWNPLVAYAVASAIMGIGFIIYGYADWTRMKQFVATAAHANGRIIHLQEHPSPDGGTYRCPVVEFTTAQGETRHFESHTCRADTFSYGDEVGVLYSEAEPTRAEIDSYLTIWQGPTSSFIAGASGLAVTLIFSWGARRYRG